MAVDLTGHFTIQSSCSHKYVPLVYNYDSNGILLEPLSNFQNMTIQQAYATVINRLNDGCFTHKLLKLENEASQALKQYLQNNDIRHQLAPPGIHRRNPANRSICTF